MNSTDFLIERLQEQIKLAPSLRENETDGGRVRQMLERLVEGINLAQHIDLLKGVESGPRRYRTAFAAAKAHVEKLLPIFEQVGAVQAASYSDGEQRQKAMSRHKDKPKEIEALCNAAIAELQKANAVLAEGEAREAKLTGVGR